MEKIKLLVPDKKIKNITRGIAYLQYICHFCGKENIVLFKGAGKYTCGCKAYILLKKLRPK